MTCGAIFVSPSLAFCTVCLSFVLAWPSSRHGGPPRDAPSLLSTFAPLPFPPSPPPHPIFQSHPIVQCRLCLHGAVTSSETEENDSSVRRTSMEPARRRRATEKEGEEMEESQQKEQQEGNMCSRGKRKGVIAISVVHSKRHKKRTAVCGHRGGYSVDNTLWGVEKLLGECKGRTRVHSANRCRTETWAMKARRGRTRPLIDQAISRT